MAGRHVELREIDYAEVLRERSGGEAAVWNQIITNCLQGSAFELDEAGVRELLGIAGDSDRLADLMVGARGERRQRRRDRRQDRGADADAEGDRRGGLERRPRAARTGAAQHGRGGRPVLARDAARADGPPRRRRRAAAGAGGRQPDDRHDDRAVRLAPRDFGERADRSPGAGVPDAGARTGSAAAAAVAGARRCRGVAARQHRRLRVGLEPRRRKAADVVLRRAATSPTPTAASCRAPARRRSRSSRSTTIRRIASRRGSARSRPPSLRALDLTLLLDLLRIEEDEDRWGELMKPVVGLLEDLLLVGDFDAAIELIAVLVREAGADRDRVDGAPAARDHRDRSPDRRLDDAAHHDPSRDDRRGAVRARQDDVRVARRSRWSGRSPRRCRWRSGRARASG